MISSIVSISLNAPTPIVSTLSGMTNTPSSSLLNLTNEVHPWKAYSPIVVKFGVWISSNEVNPFNALEGSSSPKYVIFVNEVGT